jgi:hypothetical protein
MPASRLQVPGSTFLVWADAFDEKANMAMAMHAAMEMDCIDDFMVNVVYIL